MVNHVRLKGNAARLIRGGFSKSEDLQPGGCREAVDAGLRAASGKIFGKARRGSPAQAGVL